MINVVYENSAKQSALGSQGSHNASFSCDDSLLSCQDSSLSCQNSSLSYRNQAIITLKNVSFNYPQCNELILSHIDFTIFKEDFIILLGSNGCGKSSLLKIINQLYYPTSGEITVNNAKSIRALSQNCSESLFTTLTVRENFALVLTQRLKAKLGIKRGKAKLDDFINTYLAKFNHNLAHKLDVLASDLSGGEKQALALALLLLDPPDILLLDEHTSALDPSTAHQIMLLTEKMVAEFKITCILTTHDLTLAKQYGNRLVCMKNGNLEELTVLKDGQTLTREHLLSLCY